eukprot:TRINITY_DN2836_c0_g1_i1.p1 TRINITY_DN2836_c0_g1~~TRINITY_DN2836_c0_g1_i1.p1  ORF type:complete len:1301 (-),score=259.34 TRINITY_DN2836_c0_g1_i1:157-4059(-)
MCIRDRTRSASCCVSPQRTRMSRHPKSMCARLRNTRMRSVALCCVAAVLVLGAIFSLTSSDVNVAPASPPSRTSGRREAILRESSLPQKDDVPPRVLVDPQGAESNCSSTPRANSIAVLQEQLRSGVCTREASLARARCSARWQGRELALERPHETVVLVVASMSGPGDWVAEQPFCSVIMTHAVLSELSDFDVPVNRGNEASAYLKFILMAYDSLPDSTIFVHDEVKSWHLGSDVRDLLTNLHTESYPFASLSSFYWLEAEPSHEGDYRKLGLDKLAAHDSSMMGFYCCAQFMVSAGRLKAYTKAQYGALYGRLLSVSGDALGGLSSWMAGEVYEFTWHRLFDLDRKWNEQRLDPLKLCGNSTLCGASFFTMAQDQELIKALPEQHQKQSKFAPLAVQLVSTDPNAGFFANVHFVLNQLNWLDQMAAHRKKQLPVVRVDPDTPVLRPFAYLGKHTCCFWNTNKSELNKYYEPDFGDNVFDYVFDPVDKGPGKYKSSPPATTQIFMLDRESRWALHHEDPRSVYMYYYGLHEAKRGFDLHDEVFFTKQRIKASYLVKKYLAPKGYVKAEVARILRQILRPDSQGGEHQRSAVPVASTLKAAGITLNFAPEDRTWGQPSLKADKLAPHEDNSWFLQWNRVYTFANFQAGDPWSLRTRKASVNELRERTSGAGQAMPLTKELFDLLHQRQHRPTCRWGTRPHTRAPMLGVHLRGTDKQHEIGGKIVPPQEYVPYIERYLALHPGAVVYVATDSPSFLAQLRALVPDVHFMSSDRTEANAFLDKSVASKARLAADVLIDALILSESDFILHTNSAVSEYAIYFNPRLRDSSINVQYGFTTMTRMSIMRGVPQVNSLSDLEATWKGSLVLAGREAEAPACEYPIMFDGFRGSTGGWVTVQAPELLQPFSVPTQLAFELKASPERSRVLNVMVYNDLTCGADLFFARGQPFLEFDGCDMPVRLWYGPDHKASMMDDMDVVLIPLGWNPLAPSEVLGKTNDVLPRLNSKKLGQVWVGCTLENGQTYSTTPLSSLRALGVEHMASFSQEAAIPLSFYSSFYLGEPAMRKYLRSPSHVPNKKPKVALMQAACAEVAESQGVPAHTHWRDKFISGFKQAAETSSLLASMGPCYHNTEPQFPWKGSALAQRPHAFHMNKMRNIEPYMFTLVHESVQADDWITEKVYQALSVGSIPVYRGAKNVEQYLPCKHCTINADDFESPQHLVDYLLHMVDDVKNGRTSEYDQLLQWRREPFSPTAAGALFERVRSQSIDTSLCRIAHLGVQGGCNWECGPRCWEEIYLVAKHGFHG